MEKTCGNCGNAIPIPIKEEDGTMHYDMISVCPCDWCIDLVRNEPEFVGHTPDTEPCEEWIEQKEQSLEQRYQQLADVAREMFLCISNPEKFIERSKDKYVRDGYYRWTKVFREQLEELGVEL